RREEQKQRTDSPEETHVVEAGEPHRTLRALRASRAQVLTYQRGRRVAHSPRWEQGEEDDPNADSVARAGGAAEPRTDSDQSQPARGADQNLENSGGRQSKQPQHHRWI